MVFNSFDFLLFFPLAIIGYFLTPPKYRNYIVLVSSYVFYMWWKVEYIFLIIISTLIDFFCARQMEKEDSQKRKKRFLLISLFSNLGMLFSFKYFNFFSESVGGIGEILGFTTDAPVLDILLPVGISFYTFQTLSYTIDVYRGKIRAEKNLSTFALYVSYWPQLVAGPIERSDRLLPQLKKEFSFDYRRVVEGCRLMLWGFFKKVVIADRLAVYVDQVYGAPEEYSFLPVLLATYFFAFQIYFDFSGYSDIAIGAAKIMGHDLMINFNAPYLATRFRDFWSRWHISLSTWFRDYLYIPLGGNRVTKNKWFRNLLLVFLISGLWHGANWTFVVWGALHGLYLVLEIITGFDKIGENKRLTRWLKRVFVFHLVVFAWIFFRIRDLGDFTSVINALSNWEGLQSAFVGIYPHSIEKIELLLAFGLICLVYAVELNLNGRRFEVVLQKYHTLVRFSLYTVLAAMIVILGIYGVDGQFIYFQF